MSFEIVTLSKQLIAGLTTVLPTPESFDDISAMSKVKSEYLKKYKQEASKLAKFAQDENVYGINFNDANQNYLVGVKVNDVPTGYASFSTPAGIFAKFTTKAADRNQIDQFIGAAYGELGQSDEYGIGGNYNLEVVNNFVNDADTFTLFLPAVKK
ncbi:effector binding domain-containing protein [Pediococcus ethanolidurans]|uniref:Predicted transcriptional regulator YdeE, contains AraC-type DNA-binding domain n=1 Tax=Pediococcus ethanolidurans TaxID=319653 RepID=A0A0R2JWS9_9LACO|nr:effector binding domain-containing protein [Pediococcus ethanolidurans]KRN81582.1 hypothetical protein IV87_GL001095 [Pediococcus ethanolidurans]MBU7564061.1 effector binding domain-containing protein [Pediococcus ethanolidurans]MCT4398182.1 hypothetical protein [Pediococcus ethanolidurans]SER68896.1 Predicted transcriptional regulator YdeE, contains AraC-type DNA-binding domain [Pediococcus ethanolidurans]GEN95437.1 hypothetical protein PET01_14870 [Pediococcus ethanolidurans]